MTSMSSSDRDPLERLADDFLNRRRNGEFPSPSEYADKHPSLAAQILDLFPALELMEGLKAETADGTASVREHSTPMDPRRPERLGEFQILREIGKGGMGVVYEAIQESLGRRVALKILPFHVRVDPVQIERFRVESRSAARLQHGHIVPVYGMGEHHGVYYYAMQYIQGYGLDVILADLRKLRESEAEASHAPEGSLAIARSFQTGQFETEVPPRITTGSPKTVSARQDQVTEEDRAGHDSPAAASKSVLPHTTETGYHRAVARLGVDVARALAHAHGQGVLHRDIKPSNLLLDMSGHVWVTDFGLAKQEGSEGPTQTGDIIGTLRYMAPERFEGWSDRRGDLYGLGMTLYEMLTLRSAFDAVTRAKLIDQVIHDSPPAPRKVDRQIPRDLETIVLKSIAKEPSERYANANAMATDLESYLADRPITARRSTPIEQAWRWCRRNKAAAGLLAASIFAVISLAALIIARIDNTRVLDSRRMAVQAQELAESSQRLAELARRKAEASEEREQKLSYIHRISLAAREWSDSHVARTEQLLDECRTDDRGWEWHHLKRLCHLDRLTLQGHESEVRDVCYSPDGRFLASCGLDHTVRLWDPTTGRLERCLNGQEDQFMRVQFSPDGKRLAAVSGIQTNKYGRLVVWDLLTGKEIYSVRTPTGWNASLVYSPDGVLIAIASGDIRGTSEVQLREASSGRLLRNAVSLKGMVTDLSFSPDGQLLAGSLGLADHFANWSHSGGVQVWDVASGELKYSFSGDDQPILAIDWSPDGRLIATGGLDRLLRIRDAHDGRLLSTMRGHLHLIAGVSFSHDGRKIASGSDDASVRIWDVTTGQELAVLRGHRSAICSVAFAIDDRQLATASDEGTVKIWEIEGGQESRVLGEHEGPATSVEFHPNARKLLTAGMDRTLKIWDVDTGQMSRLLRGHTREIWSAVYSPDGKTIASAGGDWSKKEELGQIILWNAETGDQVKSWHAHRSVAWCVAFSPQGKWLATAGGELTNGPGDVIIWDLDMRRPFRSISVSPNAGIHSVSFSPDGTLIATTGQDGSVIVWRVSTGERVGSYGEHKEPAYFVTFDDVGRRLAAGHRDRGVTIWDLNDNKSSTPLIGHTLGSVKGVFSHDGSRLVSASYDHSIKIWDATTGHELITLSGHVGTVWSVAFSPDGSQIASAGHDGKVRIWDSAPFRSMSEGQVHNGQRN